VMIHSLETTASCASIADRNKKVFREKGKDAKMFFRAIDTRSWNLVR